MSTSGTQMGGSVDFDCKATNVKTNTTANTNTNTNGMSTSEAGDAANYD